MDNQNYLVNILISILITLAVVLIPYIVIRLVTKRRIQEKNAKIITIIYSVISFLIFLVIGFLINSEPVSVFPVIIWNTVGYFIIKPKNTIEHKHQNTNFENLQTAESLNKQNITPTDIDIVPDKIRAILKTDYSLFTKNKYALSDTLLFTYYIISYYVSKSTMLEMQRKEFLHNVNDKLLILASEDYNYQKHEIIELWKRRNNYVKNLFLKSNEELCFSDLVQEFNLIYSYDIYKNQYVEINGSTPVILQDFDKSIDKTFLISSYFKSIIHTLSSVIFINDNGKTDEETQKNNVKFQQQKGIKDSFAASKTSSQSLFNDNMNNIYISDFINKEIYMINISAFIAKLFSCAFDAKYTTDNCFVRELLYFSQLYIINTFKRLKSTVIYENDFYITSRYLVGITFSIYPNLLICNEQEENNIKNIIRNNYFTDYDIELLYKMLYVAYKKGYTSLNQMIELFDETEQSEFILFKKNCKTYFKNLTNEITLIREKETERIERFNQHSHIVKNENVTYSLKELEKLVII